MPERRNFSPLDRLLKEADHALQTLTSGQRDATRQPQRLKGSTADIRNDEVSNKKHTAGLMRINHTGEVCAQALYQGQALTAKLPDVREKMEQAAAEEEDHLAWCEQRLQELDSAPSVLNPLFYAMSFSVGAAAGMAGDKWSLGFVSETEKQVCEHLKGHLKQLDPGDERSREILSQMYIDEAKHATTADDAGAASLPEPVRQAMRLLAKVMTTSTYRI